MMHHLPAHMSVYVFCVSGIGTGWSTHIPNYDPREIVANLKRLMDGEEPVYMVMHIKLVHHHLQ